MSTLLTSLGIDRLSVEERLRLVGEIWDSIAPEVEEQPISQAEREELERRLNSLASNPTNVVSWDEVKSRALAKFQK